MTENDFPPQSESPASGIDGLPSDTADLKGFMRDFEARMAGLEQRADQVRPLIDATSLRVSSADGEVTVTVTFGGKLVGVAFGEGARSVGEQELAAMVIETYDRAVAEAERRTAE